MKIIKAKTTILTKINRSSVVKKLETVGRVCYKSEERMTATSSSVFVKMLISRGHEAILEHYSITIKFICDRGISHEIVRHRLASYAQESTRYVRYNNDKPGKELTFIDIRPSFKYDGSLPSDRKWEWWKTAMEQSEKSYLAMTVNGATPQEARSVLPNSIKTEIIMTANLRQWRHFFKLRCAKAAHPQMRELTIPLLEKLKLELPEIFNSVEY